MQTSSALVLLQAAALPGWMDEYYSVEEALALAFPEADAFDEERVLLGPEEVEALEDRLRATRARRIFRWHVARKGDRLLGYAVTGDCLGKSEPITYMVALEPDRSVRMIEVLVYRESHGSEIRHGAFRRQFEGADTGSELLVGEDIRNIAGATISCHSITDAVHDVLEYAHVAIPAEPPAEIGEAPPVPEAPPLGGPAKGPFSRGQVAMGTTLDLTVYAASKEAGGAAMSRAFAEVARLEGLLSAFRPESELALVNAAAGGAPVPISADTRQALRRARDLASATGGAFDPTVGRLLDLWREAARSGAQPDPEVLRERLAAAGWTSLELSARGARLASACALDLGGFGKGYALERAAEELRAAGVTSARLSFGGMVLCLDAPPGAAAWEVPLRDPRAPERTLGTLRLANACAASTADHERGLAIGARRVSHVIDPRTGEPALGLVGTTVVHPRAGDADAWSTALFVLGPQEGAALASTHGLAARLVVERGVHDTPKMLTHLTTTPVDGGDG